MPNPKLIAQAFASNGLKNDIAETRRSGMADNAATYAEGFPRITMTPISAGGKPPSGQDMNGILSELSAHIVHLNQGNFYQFDASFANKINGYEKGAVLVSDNLNALFVSLVNNNKTNFNTSSYAGRWFKLPFSTENTLTSSSTETPLSAAMGKKLQDEKLGNSGDQTISNGVLTVGRPASWAAIKIPSGAGMWEIETNPQSAAAVEGSIRMGFKFVENGQQAKGIIMPALVSGYETVAYQSWVNQRIRDYEDTRVPSTAYNVDAADADFGKSGFFRTNVTALDGKRAPSMHIHAAHPTAGKKYSRGIGFAYGPTFDVYTTSWNAEGVYQGMKVILTEENGVMLSGNQTVGGTKTFSSRADFVGGIRIGGDNTERYSGLFRGTGVWYWSNPISGQSLQLKDNGDLAYQDRKIYHEGNKPSWNDIQSKPDLATRGTTLAHYGITDSVTRVDFDWAKVPSGAVMYFAGDTAPHGWLAANGAAVSRSTFPHLFAAIGTRYGAGNGSTTFNLPDLRGEFVRSLDAGRGVDSGRALGSWQGQNSENHYHGVGNISIGNDDAHLIERNWGAGYNGNARLVTGDGDRESRWHLTGGNLSTGDAIGHYGENRPRNIALLACIKI